MSAPLTYSKALPTTEGFYWYRQPGWSDDIFEIFIYKNKPYIEDDISEPLEKWPGEWAGPIPRPLDNPE